MVVSGSNSALSAGGIAQRATAVFLEGTDGRIGEATTIVEGGYFDLRHPVAPDRLRYLEASFELARELHDSDRAREIHHTAFLNDLTAAGQELDENGCQSHDSECETPSADQGHVSEFSKPLPTRAQAMYARYAAEHPPGVHEGVEIFSMRTTRNRIARLVHRGLLQKTGAPRVTSALGDVPARENLYFETADGPIHVGSRDRLTRMISIRCIGLLAQHYYDLYELARRRDPALNSLWIFDFNRITEADRVRGGAELTFAIHPWPKGVDVRIVSCNYAASDGTQGSVYVTHRDGDGHIDFRKFPL